MSDIRLAHLTRCKPLVASFYEGDEAGPRLKRSLGVFSLTMLGVGGTIGTGIFVALTTAAPEAGPAVIVSFLLAGLTAALTALCYAELASVLPESGSSYAYAYATLGEFAAFMIGACLLLEYAVSGSAIAVGWGQYLNELLVDLTGHRLPDAIAQPPGHGGWFNLPAVVLVASCMILLLRGARESARANAILVLAKLAVLALFVVIAFSAFRGQNLKPFAPKGIAGVGSAASTIFFSYIGLDVVSTAGDEAVEPQRTLPLAIILALVIVTAAYVLVAVAAMGAQPWTAFAGQEAGLAVILRDITGSTWPAVVLSLGAVVSIFSVTLVVIYGQTRILFAMSRDGLLPRFFQTVDPKTKVPTYNTMIVSAVIAAMAAFIPLDVLTNLTSLGTLAAFAVVSTGVIILRRTRPDLPRAYRTPLYPVLPACSVLFCLYLIASLPWVTHLMFIVWLGAACFVYFSYSRRRSVLAVAA
ncbi:MAG TPA: amino acid permease [Caulobacteraceae bacterium]|nr:amino acid permease [Caulobacteraceae bacterium]